VYVDDASERAYVTAKGSLCDHDVTLRLMRLIPLDRVDKLPYSSNLASCFRTKFILLDYKVHNRTRHVSHFTGIADARHLFC